MNLDVFACLASALATSKHDMQFTPCIICKLAKKFERFGGKSHFGTLIVRQRITGARMNRPYQSPIPIART